LVNLDDQGNDEGFDGGAGFLLAEEGIGADQEAIVD
jgi:hypothetical protein